MKQVAVFVTVFVALTAGCLAASSQTCSFTGGEGYVSGALDGQKGWNAMAGWTVDPSGSGKITTTTAGQRMIHNDALKMNDGESVTFRTELKLLGTVATPTANTELLLLGVRPDADETANPTEFHNTVLSLRAGNVVLRSRSNTAPQATLGTIAANATNNLAIEYKITLGASAAASTFDFKIINLDTTLSASASTNLDSTIYTALTTGSGVNSYLHSQTFAANSSGVTGIEVESVQVPGAVRSLKLIVVH
jgi:hypothetical protein